MRTPQLRSLKSPIDRATVGVLLVLVFCSSILRPQNIERTQEIVRTLTFEENSDSPRLFLDNIRGSIAVEGYDGDVVELAATRRTTAESEKRFQEAEEDVVLDIRMNADRMEISVDAPWRDRWGGYNHRGYRFYGYTVTFDFRVRVPRKTGLYVRTVENGSIEIRNVEGRFDARNVNGDVRMSEISGYGRASTVNGSIDLSFGQNPVDDCTFSSVNGSIQASFAEPFSARCVLRTFNGRAYTDFDVQPAEPELTRGVTRRGRKFYRIEDQYAVQTGEGGPTISFDTLNGDIRITKQSGGAQ